MITVQTLIDATPMYQSLSEKAQARFRKRLAKRLHKFFSKSGAVTDSLDDDFLSRFEVTADNAKKVTNLAGRPLCRWGWGRTIQRIIFYTDNLIAAFFPFHGWRFLLVPSGPHTSVRRRLSACPIWI